MSPVETYAVAVRDPSRRNAAWMPYTRFDTNVDFYLEWAEDLANRIPDMDWAVLAHSTGEPVWSRSSAVPLG